MHMGGGGRVVPLQNNIPHEGAFLLKVLPWQVYLLLIKPVRIKLKLGF